MAYTTFYNDIVFIEGINSNAKIIGSVSSDLSFKIGAQLKNLNDVKSDMANKAKALGANCIVDFIYGQKSRWLAIDDVAFYGKGKAAILPDNVYEELVNKVKNR
ncbi:hypothetical protein [Clostridium sp. 1001275B_160808_H3]|uniref:hypothetical protein n=1 Tax=Clostridium sp. 1001275B_160808_H3 TaxID=2787110 RepID=UPI00189C3B92|nr:hypothetical protein [Clostridium sp. 1001275B_160808_H3]